MESLGGQRIRCLSSLTPPMRMVVVSVHLGNEGKTENVEVNYYPVVSLETYLLGNEVVRDVVVVYNGILMPLTVVKGCWPRDAEAAVCVCQAWGPELDDVCLKNVIDSLIDLAAISRQTLQAVVSN